VPTPSPLQKKCPWATDPFADVMLSDIKEAALESLLIDLSDKLD